MHVERRTVLQAGGLIAVGGLVAACGGGTDASATSAPAADGAATSAPAGSASAASPAASASASAALAGALAQVSDVPVGGGIIIADPAVVITQPKDGEIKCFSAVCTHQGCLVGSVENNEIVCPCHGSTFSATDGAVIQGPATTALPAQQVTVADGTVILG